MKFMILATTPETCDGSNDTVHHIVEAVNHDVAIKSFCDDYWVPLMDKICDPKVVAEWNEWTKDPKQMEEYGRSPFCYKHFKSCYGDGQLCDPEVGGLKSWWYGYNNDFCWDVIVVELQCLLDENSTRLVDNFNE